MAGDEVGDPAHPAAMIDSRSSSGWGVRGSIRSIFGPQSSKADGTNMYSSTSVPITPMAAYRPNFLIGLSSLVQSEISPSDVVLADRKQGSQAIFRPRAGGPFHAIFGGVVPPVVDDVDRPGHAHRVDDRGHVQQDRVHRVAGKRDDGQTDAQRCTRG